MLMICKPVLISKTRGGLQNRGLKALWNAGCKRGGLLRRIPGSGFETRVAILVSQLFLLLRRIPGSGFETLAIKMIMKIKISY